jgi:two-component system cell cycle response regulator DivK
MKNAEKDFKILIVEDNSLNLKLFQDLLAIRNYQVVATQKALEVMDLVTINSPDLILMDIQLRGISGVDIIKSLKSSNDTKHIPVIAITAFAMKYDKVNIMQSGCDMYISKPVSIDDFYSAIESFTISKCEL